MRIAQLKRKVKELEAELEKLRISDKYWQEQYMKLMVRVTNALTVVD